MNKLFYPMVIAVYFFTNVAFSQNINAETPIEKDTCRFKIGLLSGKVICSTNLTENKIDNDKKGFLATADGKEYPITQVSYFQKPDGYYKYLTYNGIRSLYERDTEGKISKYTKSSYGMGYYSGGMYYGGGSSTLYFYEKNNSGVSKKLNYYNLDSDMYNCKSCQEPLRKIRNINTAATITSLVGLGAMISGIAVGQSGGSPEVAIPLALGGLIGFSIPIVASSSARKKHLNIAIKNYNEEFK